MIVQNFSVHFSSLLICPAPSSPLLLQVTTLHWTVDLLCSPISISYRDRVKFELIVLKFKKNQTTGSDINVFSNLIPNSLPQFLPRCMECRRGLAMRILSVRHTRGL